MNFFFVHASKLFLASASVFLQKLMAMLLICEIPEQTCSTFWKIFPIDLWQPASLTFIVLVFTLGHKYLHTFKLNHVERLSVCGIDCENSKRLWDTQEVPRSLERPRTEAARWTLFFLLSFFFVVVVVVVWGWRGQG